MTDKPVSETSDTPHGDVSHLATDVPLDYIELRSTVYDGRHTADVTANPTNGMVEVWIDPPTLNVEAVANLRIDPEHARTIGRALLAAASVVSPEMDGTEEVQ